MKPSAEKLFEVVDYSPEVHGAFVRSTWAYGALRDGSRAARERLDGYLAERGARCVLGHLRDQPDRFAGWAAVTDRALVFAFVLPVVRRRGLCRLMLDALDLPKHLPVPLLHWTPSAQECAAAGVPVYHAVYPIHA